MAKPLFNIFIQKYIINQFNILFHSFLVFISELFKCHHIKGE